MYLYSIINLLVGSRLVLYDGSPFKPDITSFIRLMERQKVTHLGISPRYLLELQQNKVVPRKLADLSSLKHVVSTGMVLSDQLFEWFYDTGFPQTAQLANISGGTDIAGCFGMENPLNPVYVGGCQGPSLGTAIAVFEERLQADGSPQIVRLEDGVPGELVA